MLNVATSTVPTQESMMSCSSLFTLTLVTHGLPVAAVRLAAYYE